MFRGLRLVLTLVVAQTVLPGADLTHGPMVGHTAHDSTRIWVRADSAAEAQVRLIGPAGEAIQSETVRLAAEDNFSGTVMASGLSPETTYTYRVWLDGVEVQAAMAQNVTTFPPPGKNGIVRIGFGHSLIGPGEQTVWNTIAAKSPDLFLLMGDNIYSNSTEPEKQRRMYLQYRADPHFRAFGAATPIYAIWDDHDFGKDNSDRTQEGKDRALRTFHELWPNPPAEAKIERGIWSKFTVGRSEFYLLDVRYNRSPDDDPDGPEKTMLGNEQREWFVGAMAESRATFKFPVSGSSWHCGGVEAWNHQYLHEYDRILAEVRDRKISGIALLGGDQHKCVIAVRPKESWGGYDLHEWRAGRLWAGDREQDIKGFGMITVNTLTEPAEVKMEFFGHSGLPLEGRRILYTTPGALRAMWDSPPGSMGKPVRSADGEIRPTTSGPIWEALPLTTGETLTIEDLR
jgi:alkaline phosphatase D